MNVGSGVADNIKGITGWEVWLKRERKMLDENRVDCQFFQKLQVHLLFTPWRARKNMIMVDGKSTKPGKSSLLRAL